MTSVPSIPFDVPPYRLSGSVYGTLLNHRAELDALGEAANARPYKAAPKAPVLYVKPRNTLRGDGAVVEVPADAVELECGAALGIVIGRTACRVGVTDAAHFIAGYTVVADLSVPHESYYRPSLRFKIRDGFCPLGPRVVPAGEITDPDALDVRVLVDGREVQSTSTGGMVRPVGTLISDVTEFMTLQPGDVLMLGVAAGAPLVRAGQHVAIEIAGLGRLQFRFVAEGKQS